MFAKLLVIAGPDRGKRFEVVPAVPLVMGRSGEADARLRDPRVSPIHCKVSVRNATLFVMDMDSLTGTSVNNVFVTVEYPLQFGDTFTIGDSVLLMQDPDAPDPPQMAAPQPAAPTLAVMPATARPQPAPPPSPARTLPATPAPARPQPAPPPSPAKSSPNLTPVSGLPDRADELPGHELSHYRVGKMLARGRTGFVFQATDLKARRQIGL